MKMNDDFFVYTYYEVVAQEQKRVTVTATAVDSIHIRGNEIFNIFISSFLCSGVEFRHSTQQAECLSTY